MKNNMKKGFTLVELLVVMAILAILALLAVPRFVTVQKQANERTFLTNHRTLQSMVTLYSSGHDGRLPTNISDLTSYVEKGGTLLSSTRHLGQEGAHFSIAGNRLVGTLSSGQTVKNTLLTTSFQMQ